MTRYGMVINLDRCIGCYACATACTIHHGLPKDVRWSHVYELTKGTFPDVATMFLPTLCMQCEKPLCVAACPTGASYIGDDGIVKIDLEKCIGDGACVEACPYKARVVVGDIVSNHEGAEPNVYEQHVFPGHISQVAEKCTFCSDLLEKGEEPWCVRTCMSDARIFGDLDDPNSEVAKAVAGKDVKVLLGDKGTNPSVYYINTSRISVDEAFPAKE